MSMLPFPHCFLDIETTGFQPGTCEIIEIFIQDSSGKSLEYLIQPTGVVPRRITEITGITEEMLAEQPLIADVIDDIAKFIEGKVVIAHNAVFDLGFIAFEIWNNLGEIYEIPYLCTLNMARNLFSEKSYALGAITTQFGYIGSVNHRAEGDVEALKFLTMKIIENYKLNGKLDRNSLEKGGFLKHFSFDGVSSNSKNGTKYSFQPRYDTLPVPIVLKFSYARPKGKKQEYRVKVLKLATNQENRYLYGTCLNSGENKHFRVDRIVGDIYNEEDGKKLLSEELSNILKPSRNSQSDIEEESEYDGIDDEFNAEDIPNFYETVRSPNIEKIQSLLKELPGINSYNYQDNRTLLMFVAAENTNPNLVRMLVEKGARLDLEDICGWNPLIHAAMFNSEPNIHSTLIEAGAEVNFKAFDGDTALILAAECNLNPAVIRVLLKFGAKINEVDKNGLNAVLRAAKSNTNPLIIKFLVEAGANLNAKDKNGLSALSIAAKHNTDPKIIQCLIEAGAGIEAKVDDGWTALLIAARHNPNAKVLECLIKAGADVEAKNSDGFTALMLAAAYNYSPDVIECLINAGADIHEIDKNGRTAIMLAARYNISPEIIEALVDAGSAVEDTDDSNFTALMLAAGFNSSPKVIKALINQGADVEMRDNYRWSTLMMKHFENEGKTALMVSARYSKNPDNIRVLIEEGANIDAIDNDGWTALMYASAFNENPEFVEILIEANADVDARSNDGWPALLCAASYNSNPDVVEYLIEAGADFNARNFDGWTSLMIACADNTMEVVRALINTEEIDLEARATDGSTALMIATSNNSDPRITEALVNKGCNLEAVDADGYTALMCAAAFNENPEVISTLLKLGANACAKNAEGKTPFDLAAENEALKNTPAFWALNDARFNKSSSKKAAKNQFIREGKSLNEFGSSQDILLSSDFVERIKSFTPKGDGGFQRLIRMLQDNLSGNKLKLNDEQKNRVVRYSEKYGKGGYQLVFRAIKDALQKQ